LDDPRCRAGKHCSAHTDDGPAVTVKRETLCAACCVAIQTQLDELPHLALALRAFRGGSIRMAHTSKVSRTPAPQVPLNITVTDLIDEIGDVIDRTDNLPVRDLILRPAQLFRIWVKGKPHEKWIDGVDRAIDIGRVNDRVRGVVGLHRIRQARAAPCPACNEHTLSSWVGDDTVSCTDEECGVFMTLDDYDKYCWILSKETK
jgi:hypothetical protein